MFENIENIKEIIAILGSIIGIAPFVLSLLIVGFLIGRIKNNIIKISEDRLKQNGNTNKYIKEVYIEVGNSSEKLRYFSNKQMRRVGANRLKILLKDRVGNIIKKACKLNVFRSNSFYFRRNLDRISNFFLESHPNNSLKSFARGNSYFIQREIEELKDLEAQYSKNIMIVKGNAGSGKTNLIYDYAQKELKNKQCLMYFNCKSIDRDIKDYFYNSFFVNGDSKLKKVAINILFFIMFVFQKKIIVVFEGVNESENPNFDNQLIEFINSFNLTFIRKRVLKFIVSTREEHFTNSFKKTLTDNIEQDKLEYNDVIPVDMYDADFENIIQKYSAHFQFGGTISNSTQKVISQSFFMIRLFFELYSKCNESVDISNSRDIFQAYIKHLSTVTKSAQGILHDMCDLMVQNGKYDFVLYSDLKKRGYDEEEINNLINNSTLITKHIRYGNNYSLSIDKYCIAFVFDEFRDFLLASYSIETKQVQKVLQKIVYNNYTCKEGVIKYIYLSLRLDNNKLYEKIILNGFVNDIYVNYKKNHINILTSIILDSNLNPKKIEIEYIHLKTIYRDDARLVLDRIINNLYLNDDAIHMILDYINSQIGAFNDAFNMYSLQELDLIITTQKAKGYNNSEVLNKLMAISQQLKNEEEDNEYFESEECKYYYEFDYKYVPLFKNRMMGTKEFVHSFKVEKNSYYYKKMAYMYKSYFGFYWNPRQIYNKYYLKYYDSFEEFVVARYKFPYEKLNVLVKSDLRIKFSFSGKDNSIYGYTRVESIKSILGEVIKNHYDDTKWICNK